VPASIHAELELTDCSGELWVNGIPIPSLPIRRPSFEVSVPCQHALISGMNQLELWVDVDGKPHENKAPRKAPPRPTARAIARLVAYEPGVQAAPENGEVLATLEYDGAKDEKDEAPRLRRLGIDLGRSFGPWAWQKAPVLTLDDLTQREAAAAAREIHGALFGGDPQRVFDLIRLRWEEMDRAYPGRDDAVDRAHHAAWIEELARDPRRNVPLDPDHHAFRLIADGRMIELIDDDFFPSIRIAHEVEPDRWVAAPYAICLARVGGRLTVVR
jgi:hypothetical protein